MDELTFGSLYTGTVKALTEGRLGKALAELDVLLYGSDDWRLKDKLSECRSSYEMMLNYMAKALPDADRERLYKRFIREGLEVADAAHMHHLSQESTLHFYATRRMLAKLYPEGFIGLIDRINDVVATAALLAEAAPNPGNRDRLSQIHKQRYALMAALFEFIWTSDALSRAEDEALQSLLGRTTLPEEDKAVILSALMLGAMTYFDVRKLMLLLDHCASDVPQLKARALVGAVIVLTTHHARLTYYSEVTDRLRVMQDIPDFAKEVALLQLQLVISMETQNIEKKMRDDILPSMMKTQHFRSEKFGLDTIDELLAADEANPEWTERKDVKRIEQAMQHLAELQAQGADVYMGTFATLKQRYPFYRQTVNWFYPFVPQHPELQTSDFAGSGLLTKFVESGILCDSDKYSFALMLSDIPVQQRDLIQEQLGKLGVGGAEMKPLESMTTHEIEQPMRRYLQDLYRFFKLFRYHNEMSDWFKSSLFLPDYEPLEALIESSEQMSQLADFTFRQKSYDMARKFFLCMERKGETSADMLQKLGCCYQHLGQLDTALTYYERANLLKADSVWTIRHLAQGYRQQGRHDKAVFYYKQLEQLEPDNLMTLLRLGEELIRTKSYEEALTYLYKVDYLSEGTDKAARAIAWCSFLLGKFDHAEKYYRKIMSGHSTAEDYINAGHVAWVRGDISEAIVRYKQAQRLLTSDEPSFLQPDAEELAQFGITPIDLRLMEDYLSMNE